MRSEHDSLDRAHGLAERDEHGVAPPAAAHRGAPEPTAAEPAQGRSQVRSQDLPHRPALLGQVLLGLALFAGYLLVDARGGEGALRAARRHGQQVLDLERHLHLDVEQWLNARLAPHHAWAVAANYEYAYTYILSALALFAWVWVRRPEEWRYARDSFVVLNLVAFTAFLCFPTAPPRMLPGFVDTVTRGATVGSWGSGSVDWANQVAAMPSLHVGWALWVSVVLARFTARRTVQVISALHVALTVLVVMATANHYLLDAVAVVVPILLGTAYAGWRHDGPAGVVVPSGDAFFLHVEATGAAQHVGGVVQLGPGPAPTLDQVRRLAAERLVPLPHLRQRVEASSRWRRPRWVEVPVDLEAHVSERVVQGPGPEAAVAALAEEPLPRDRPLWRLVLVRTTGPHPPASTVVFIVHHAVADGIATIASAMRLFDPVVDLPVLPRPRPGALRRAGAVAVGLAQLATDGGARPVGPGSARRQYARATADFAQVRSAARARGVAVTDLVLGLTVEAVRASAPQLVEQVRGTLALSVPVMLRRAEALAPGNATGAVILNVATSGTRDDLLAAAARRTGRLRRPTRALASRFVMATGLRLLPEPAAAWFARTVYGARFLHVVVSNLPGPAQRLHMFDRVPDAVHPILPLAPGTPMALGALSWAGELGIGLATDPALLDAAAVAAALQHGLDEVVAGVERLSERAR